MPSNDLTSWQLVAAKNNFFLNRESSLTTSLADEKFIKVIKVAKIINIRRW